VSGARALLAAVVVCGATACNEQAERPETQKSTPPPATATAGAATEPKATPPPQPAPGDSSAAEDTAHFEAKTCRAIVVKGAPKDSQGNVVSAMAPLDGTVWLDLPDKSWVTVKHAVTGRELTFTGPGLVLPCKNGKEWFVLVRGRASTTTWAGAAPGAEVLLSTPFTLVRYGDATLDVTVEDSRLLVKAIRGDAWLESGKEGGASDRKVAAGTQEVRSGAPEDPRALLSDCEQAAARSESMARETLSGKSGVPLGESAAAHVRARRAATAACAVADAALGRLALGPEREGLARALKKAETRYRALPSLSPPGSK
jgi:hypothetical protein